MMTSKFPNSNKIRGLEFLFCYAATLVVPPLRDIFWAWALLEHKMGGIPHPDQAPRKHVSIGGTT